jgi:hypothetical protein
MDDFDYISEGGFIIECRDGDTLGVTRAQAERMKIECEFVRNCFRHNTKEQASGILCKPDWSIAIARHLVEALTKDQTTVSNLELYEQVLKAGDQALVDLRLCNLVNYIEPTEKEATELFSTLVHPGKFRFEIVAKVTSKQWTNLLGQGILLHRKETNFVLRVAKDQAMDRSQAMAKRKLDTKVSEYRVHTDLSIRGLLEISRVLSNGVSLKDVVPASEKYSIYFETLGECFPQHHHDLIDRLAGGYIRTCPDSSNVSQGYTVEGSFDLLRRALRPLQEAITANKDNIPSSSCFCSLRIDDPTPDTLGRFINACQIAHDFPRTLGLDAVSKRYFCRKTVRDVLIILDYLADFSTNANVSGEFRVMEFSSEDTPF